MLTATGGRAILDGGPGNDVLSGERLDDRITSRDGFADRVRCGDGVDTVIADSLDTISPTCENVDVADPPPAAPVAAPQPPAPAQPPRPPARTTPRLSLAVTPGRDRTAPFRFRATGALALHGRDGEGRVHAGPVIVRVTSGAKTVAARRPT